MRLHLFAALPLCFSLAASALAATDTPEIPADSATLGQELSSGFYSRINVLGFGIYQDVNKDSPVNPQNILKIPRNQAEIDFRPDFNLNFRQFEFGLKPRLEYSRSKVDQGNVSMTDSDHRFFINGAFARYRMTDKLLAIYGRENLQWGPSALLSPSNPFNANNGRNNPNLELPGLDYVRLVAIPNSAVTVSLIANTGSGRLEQNIPFQKTYAGKLDYTGNGHYFSIISSYRENERLRLGFFGGWDVSDALLVYTEGSAAKKADTPVSTKNDFRLLAGAAYTLESGPTINAEYFHNNPGCVITRIDLCLAQQNGLIDPRNPLLRRRYALLQYVDTKLLNNLNLAVRFIKNIDDSSAQLIFRLEYEIGEHLQLYAIPTFYSGGRDTEFGSLSQRSAFIGAAYTF